MAERITARDKGHLAGGRWKKNQMNEMWKIS